MGSGPEEDRWTVELSDTGALASSDLRELRRLMDEAFGGRFSEADWRHALGGTHVVARDRAGVIASHAAVVPRTLEVSGRRCATGYVEAVATRPRLQRRGLGTAVMDAVADLIRDRYEMGALSSGLSFYEGLGWIRWRGPTWCRRDGALLRTEEEDGGVFVLPAGSGPELDYDGDIVVEWRPGDVW